LTDILAEGCDVPALLPVFEQVCQAVAYAHEKGLIHRDLKPANVMVGAYGEVQGMDWGLAKTLDQPQPPARAEPGAQARAIDTDRNAESTAAGSVVGTLAYMPPEQARAELGRVGRHSDVFSLGGILCEILTGEPPYTGPRAVVRAHAELGMTDGAFARLDQSKADPELNTSRKLAK